MRTTAGKDIEQFINELRIWADTGHTLPLTLIEVLRESAGTLDALNNKIKRLEAEATVEKDVSDEDFASLIGEGVHTGLRKGTDAESAHDLWLAISNSTDTAWSDAVGFCVWGIGYAGYVLRKKEKK